MEDAINTRSEHDAINGTNVEAGTVPCSLPMHGPMYGPWPKPKHKKQHVSPLIVVKQRIDEGMQPMELAQDEKYFDIIMKNITFLEKYTLHIQIQRQQADINKVLDRVINHVVVTEKDGPIPGL